MSPGFRHIERGILPRYAGAIVVRTYPSGERRVSRAPSKEILAAALEELGTQASVASAFGVTRGTVKHWASEYGMILTSRPEAGLASVMKKRMAGDVERTKVAQWLMDEGSVSVGYFAKGDYTVLLVCGSMNDYDVLASVSVVLDTAITSSKAPGPTTLPMGALRVQSARAFALLETIVPYLVGLKAREAKAALRFFPASGILRGRHTTDEFLLNVWKDFAMNSLLEWNKRRRVKITQLEILERAEKWVAARVRRARRYVDATAKSIGESPESRS